MSLVFHGRTTPSDVPTWITAVAPTPEELKTLRDMGFDAESIEHALDPHERPRVRVLVSGAVFVVLRTPLPTGHAIPYETTALCFLVPHDKDRPGLTLARVAPPLAKALIEATDRECDPARSTRVLLRALELTAASYLESLDDLGARIETTEDALQRRLRNAQVLHLVSYQRSLVHFGEALEGMFSLVDRLQKVPNLVESDEERGALEDVFVELRQAREMTRMSREVLSGMMDAFGSVIANNLNDVMKVIASLTVVATVPMTVSSLYGMNVALPGAHSPYAFVALLLTSLGLASVVAILFRRKRWL